MSSDLVKKTVAFFKFKYEYEGDSITDRYNRTLMVQVMLAAVLITGLNWKTDSVNCIVSESWADKQFPAYVRASCWINGLYIFKELKDTPGFQGYYGIPMDVTHNGTYGDSMPVQARTCEANGYDPNCKPMTKEFYLQYQYFPFLLGIFSILYYLPYMCFYKVNFDLRCLKKNLEEDDPNYDEILATYFSKRTNKFLQRSRIALNLVIKVIYLITHIAVLEVIDFTTNGNFRSFFTRWMKWTSLSNNDAHNYVGVREYIKPGEHLLPTFGFCDVLEESADVKHTLLNEHRFVCEISQHIMYHYVLIAIWLFVVVGITVSVIGLVEAIFRHLNHQSYLTDDEEAAQVVYPNLSLRQRQYMDYVYKVNLERYGMLLRKLHSDPQYVKREQ